MKLNTILQCILIYYIDRMSNMKRFKTFQNFNGKMIQNF